MGIINLPKLHNGLYTGRSLDFNNPVFRGCTYAITANDIGPTLYTEQSKGTIRGAYALVPNKVIGGRPCIGMPKATNGRILVPSQYVPSGRSDRSISAWFRLNDTTGHKIYWDQGTFSSAARCLLYRNSNGNLNLEIYSFTGIIISSYTIDTNWHHLVFAIYTAAGSGGSYLNFYQDGLLLATLAAPVPSYINTTSTVGYINCIVDDAGVTAYQDLDINEYCIFNRILSATDAKELYSFSSRLYQPQGPK